MKKNILFTIFNILMLIVPITILKCSDYNSETNYLFFESNFLIKCSLELPFIEVIHSLMKYLILLFYCNIIFLLIGCRKICNVREIDKHEFKNLFSKLIHKAFIIHLLIKIIVNLFVAFFILPLILVTKELNTVFSNDFNTNKEYIKLFLEDLGYPFISYLFLIIILFPFQLIKDWYYRNNKKLVFIKKTGILLLLMINSFIIGHIFFDFLISSFLIEIFVAIILSLVFTTILYFLIDKYVEIKPEK